MIDTHAHLDALEEPSEVLARARAAGVNRVVTIGTGIESCRAALALTAHEGVFAALGIDPHQAGTGAATRVHELREPEPLFKKLDPGIVDDELGRLDAA